MIRWFHGIPVLALLLVTACERKALEAQVRPVAPAQAANTNQQIFPARGVIVALAPQENSIRIRHEEIPNYMDAMTMNFAVRDTNELTGLAVGDTISFRMLVTETDGWIDQLKKLAGPPETNSLPAGAPIRIVRDVEPLNVGDLLPDYRFTNQLGQAVNLAQFRGQALAITFIFTRCPFPTFCPLMSNNFRKVQEGLLQAPNAPTNWVLLSVTIDPEFDTAETLRTYAAHYEADPAHWNFLTAPLIDITAFSEQVGLQFWREPGGGINHNLRTVVVDARGRVAQIIAENKWTVAELIAAVSQAARAQ